VFELCCTVRGCSRILELRENGLHCAAGHHFDRARAGYWNLLQPQDTKSRRAGDSDEAVLARRRWLDGGHMNGLLSFLRSWLAAHPDGHADDQIDRVIDLGCGEGYFGAALFAEPKFSYCGIDLSKRAIKLAARRWPQATWVMANADRFLPAADRSVRRVVSLFGRRPISEIERVLADDGEVLVAVPAEDDLIELRSEVQQAGHRRRRWEMIVDQFSAAGFACRMHQNWTEQIDLDRDAVHDAAAMSYRGVRHSQQERLQSLDAMEVTVSADLLGFNRRT